MKEWFTSYFIYFSKTHFRCSNPLFTKLYDASDKVKQTSYQHHKKADLLLKIPNFVHFFPPNLSSVNLFHYFCPSVLKITNT